jgi:hypothetical protein
MSANYRSVAVLAPGRYVTSDGSTWEVTDSVIDQLAAGYDPQLYQATINVDHTNWGGPAYGLIPALRKGTDGLLYADLADVYAPLADEIDSGRWPARSVEVNFDIWGQPLYLTGLAFLGQKLPAVAGLPPMPPREAAGDSHSTDTEYFDGLAAALPQAVALSIPEVRARSVRLTAGVEAGVAIYPISQEERMPTPSAEAQLPPRPDPDVPELAATSVQLARELSSENGRLRDQVQQLLLERRDRELAGLERQLLAGGRLIPAQLPAFRALAAALHPLPSQGYLLADGTSQGTGRTPLELLQALLSTALPQVPLGELAAEVPGAQQTGVQLYGDAQRVCLELGLTAQQYMAELRGISILGGND